MNPSFRQICILAALAAGVSVRATAGDGVVDIRPDGAATYSITTSGSYRLVSNVTMAADVPAIRITASGVTLDLNGHAITGLGAGTANGIEQTGGRTRIRIFNGTVRNFGADCISLDAFTTLENMIVDTAGSDGILVGWNSIVKDCATNTCGHYGIVTGYQSRVSGCTVVASALHGISAAANCIVENCVATGNCTLGASSAISVANNCTVRGCAVNDNIAAAGAVTGISGGQSCSIIENTVTGSAGTSSVKGIEVGLGSRIAGNTIRNNDSSGASAYGIDANSRCMVESNQVYDNDGASAAYGIDVGDGSLVKGNTSSENDSTVAGDVYGIYASSNCTILDNVCTANNEGPSTFNTSYGIYASINSIIKGNTCTLNSGTAPDGHAWGIRSSTGCLVEGNNCTDNDAIGTGSGVGIRLFGDTRCVGNVCFSNAGGVSGIGRGIWAESSGNTIINNSTSGHSALHGIDIDFTGNFHELNRCREGTTIAGSIEGTGDHVDVDF